MCDDLDEYDGLLDDDPALDCILYGEMEKDRKNCQNNGGCGCLGVVVILVPFATSALWIFR